MLDEGKLDDIFGDFIRSGTGSGDDIKQIYNTLPYLNPEQIRQLTLLAALSKKYDSLVLAEIVEKIQVYAKQNRKTGFRFTRLIESYSLYKHFKGYSASTKMGDDKI